MKNIFESIKRTPYQSIASFLILFFTLFLTLFFFTLTSFFSGMLDYVEAKPQVTVYFQPTVSEADIFKVRDDLTQSGKTSSIKYVSREDALKIYREMNKSNPLLLEMVSSDILPASLEVYAKQPEYLNQIADYLKNKPGIDEVEFQKNIVDKLMSITDILRKVSIFIFMFLLLISFVVLMTTTAFKIALRKEEIELMQLLGATKGYIRRPYLVEGMFFGLVSGTFAFIIYYGIFFLASGFLNSYLTGISDIEFYHLGSLGLFVWPPSILFIALSYFITIFFGITIGLIGNYLSTSKYIE
jgi:cell division transport system permease protein